jgi:hypothetical protein
MDEYDEDEEISEEMDESDEVDDDDNLEGQSEISSEEDEEHLIHANGIKKFNQHLSIHQQNIDLLGIDGQPSDAYLQSMNDSLHKKFRRQNHLDLLHTNNNNQMYQSGQLNGDYKNKPITDNGQDDDDDIVLVSDSDDSADKKSDTKINSIILSFFLKFNCTFPDLDLPSSQQASMTYVADIPTIYVESVTTIKSIVNDNIYAKDLLEDVDRVRCCLFN